VVGGGLDGGGVVPSVTEKSSKFPVAWNVCAPIRPVGPWLVPEPIWVPFTNPRTVVPDSSMRTVKKVPVPMPGVAVPSTVTEPLRTAWSWTRPPVSSTTRSKLVAPDARAATPTNPSELTNCSALTRAERT
jgi:hypothetical protein